MLLGRVLPPPPPTSLALIHPAVRSPALPLSYISSASPSPLQFMVLSRLSVLPCPCVSKSTSPHPPLSHTHIPTHPPSILPPFCLPAPRILVILFLCCLDFHSGPFLFLRALASPSAKNLRQVPVLEKKINSAAAAAAQQFHWADSVCMLCTN